MNRRRLNGSMSDLFHEAIPDDYVRRAFDVMVRADWHVFQVLTKRAPRLARLGRSLPWRPHIWAGVSVESNRYAFRADHLRQVPAPVRFTSAEPLPGPLDRLSLEGIHWLITGGESGPPSAVRPRLGPRAAGPSRDREAWRSSTSNGAGRHRGPAAGCSTAGRG